MKRAALDASPRGPSSNSAVILGWMVEGFRCAGAGEVPVVHLARDAEASRTALLSADEILIAFPLYTDFLPGLLKEFLDSLVPLEPSLLEGKRIAWIIHSGFPESIHCEAVAAWLRRATERLGMKCAGILVKGGSEGLRLMPPAMTRKVHGAFADSAASLVETGGFNEASAKFLAGKRRYGFFGRLAISVLRSAGFLDFYWNSMLRKHGAMDRRYDAPYGEPYGKSTRTGHHEGA